MPDRRQSLSFDRVADVYDATRGGDDRGEAIAAALSPHLPRDGRVLELGVGTGAVAAAVRRQGIDVVGVDLSRAMLAHATRRLGRRVAVADVLRLPVRDASLDAAYAVWLLHLVADVEAALVEVARVLRPGGTLVVVPGRAVSSSGEDVWACFGQMWRRLQPAGPPDRPERLVDLAGRHGLGLTAQDQLPSSRRSVTPRQLAAGMAARTFSVLWEIDDDVWEREMVPLLEEVQALPDQDRPRESVDHYALLGFTRTA